MSSSPVFLKPACLKTLSAVEAHPEVSNQHELNGVSQLKNMLGTARYEEVAYFEVRGAPITATAKVTWYDAREDHPTRSEHRLYFQTNAVMKHAKEGDNILVGFDSARKLHFVLIPTGAPGHKPNVSSWEPVA
jgi:hypothetical protein